VDADAWDAMVRVGRIGRPHGIRGDVVVSPDTDFVDERFEVGASLWTRAGRELERLDVVKVMTIGRRLVVGFRGVATVDDAERLVGAELRVTEAALMPLAPGAYYLHQLVGCRVEDVAGQPLGDVVRVDGGSGASVLVVQGARGEVLVPFAQPLCPTIDVAQRVIRVDLPEGLLDVNVTVGRRAEARRARRARLERPASGSGTG
jgi:16S rRNA processing protein RimM